jgi:hypothetical protein
MLRGLLIPDEIIIPMVAERVQALLDTSKGFILDGAGLFLPPHLPISVVWSTIRGPRYFVQFRFAAAATPTNAIFTTARGAYTVDLMQPEAQSTQIMPAAVSAQSLKDLADRISSSNSKLTVTFSGCTKTEKVSVPFQVPYEAVNSNALDEEALRVGRGVCYADCEYAMLPSERGIAWRR